MLQVFLEGFLLQASLIMALGAQNLFVLESGMRRQYHLTVSFVCFLCDLTIIMLGVMGAATLFHHFPEFKIVVGIVGIIFLLQYGIGKLRQNFGAIGVLRKQLRGAFLNLRVRMLEQRLPAGERDLRRLDQSFPDFD